MAVLSAACENNVREAEPRPAATAETASTTTTLPPTTTTTTSTTTTSTTTTTTLPPPTTTTVVYADGEPGSCLILEERFCRTGELVVFMSEDSPNTRLGFRLPAGTPVFALYDGVIRPGNAVLGGSNQRENRLGDPMWANFPHAMTAEGFTMFRAVFIDEAEQRPTSDTEVQSGDLIGRMSGDVLSGATDYNLVVFLTIEGRVDAETFEELFGFMPPP